MHICVDFGHTTIKKNPKTGLGTRREDVMK
jgi:hypothetical protein